LLAQFVCAPQFFKTPSGLCGHTVIPKLIAAKEVDGKEKKN
jgi:hypothetical protein